MRHPAYPEYKDSGMQWLGEVPGHWEVKRGRFAMRVNPPAPILRKLVENQEISFVPMDAVNEYGGIRLEQTRVKAEVGGGYTEFQDGDVVIAKITPCFENGKGSIATGLVNSAAYGTTELHVLRSSQSLDNRFLFYLTITDGYRKLGESEMYGAGGQKRVPPEFCKDFLTPLPPLPEQTAIADFLDRETGRIDTLVSKKRRLIALLKKKRIALISRTVTRGLSAAAAREFGLKPHTRFKDTGIEWLEKVPETWQMVPVKYLCDAIVDCKNRTPEYFDDGEYFVVRTTDVKDGKICFDTMFKTDLENYLIWTQRGAPKKGDVLFTREAPAGEAAIFEGNKTMCLGQRMMYFRPNQSRLNSIFLKFWIYSDVGCGYISSLSGGSTVTHLRVGQILNFPVVAIPINEQNAIATYLNRETAKIDKLVELIETAIARLQEYRTALVTAAVTGKIDVRN